MIARARVRVTAVGQRRHWDNGIIRIRITVGEERRHFSCRFGGCNHQWRCTEPERAATAPSWDAQRGECPRRRTRKRLVHGRWAPGRTRDDAAKSYRSAGNFSDLKLGIVSRNGGLRVRAGEGDSHRRRDSRARIPLTVLDGQASSTTVIPQACAAGPRYHQLAKTPRHS